MDADQKDVVFLEQNSMLRSLLLAHEHLYQSKDLCRINFHDYIEDVISHICLTYEKTQGILITVAAKGVDLDLDSLLPCGLLVTELVTNALKYAFPEQLSCSGGYQGKITVNAEWDGLAVTLVVADNGVGLPTGLDWTKTNTTGFLLVRMLGEHRLHGRILVDCTSGTSFRLRFVPRILL
jgi:two-component sensor histidine kinase